jgi:hypothetical protein
MVHPHSQASHIQTDYHHSDLLQTISPDPSPRHSVIHQGFTLWTLLLQIQEVIKQ